MVNVLTFEAGSFGNRRCRFALVVRLHLVNPYNSLALQTSLNKSRISFHFETASVDVIGELDGGLTHGSQN